MSGDPIGPTERIAADLAALGIEADEVELMVMNAMQQMLGPPIEELVGAEFEAPLSERADDFGREPRR